METYEILGLWYVQALLVSAGASLFLNGTPFLPYLRDIHPRRIQARLVGYGGLGIAYSLWCILNPQQAVWPIGLGACAIIVAGTLSANVLIHWYRQDNPRDGGNIQIGLTEKGQALLEELLREQAPKERELSGIFKREQRQATAKERWEDAMFPANTLPGLLDEIMGCIVRAMKDGQPAWLLTALADVQEARQEVIKTKWNLSLWYQLFWPECAG